MAVLGVAIALYFAFFATAHPNQHHGVQTTGGYVTGHSASNRPDVTEFLGIRYARAPVGELRYAAPVRSEAARDAVYDARDWAPDCPNNKPPVSSFPEFAPNGLRIWRNFVSQVVPANPVNEDCLALNIWTKSSDRGAKKPVFVFFHGGRFLVPGPHSPFFNGQYFSSAEDVVVVTVAYRLGIFGFSGAPNLPQNAALRDQRSAVEWVRDNIRGFGGDPARIIIFGQSVGGASVDYYTHAHRKDPIIAGAISHSGTTLSFLPNTVDYSRSLWYNASGTLGCGGPADDAGKVLDCMRSKSYTAVLAAAARVPALPSQALPQAAFHPTIDNELVFSDYEALGKAGEFSLVPFVAGNTDYEAGWYKISAFGQNRTLTEAQWELYDERAFTCPSRTSVQYRVQQHVPTWRYRYMGTWDNLRMYGASGENTTSLGRGSGAYHGSELSLLFGTTQDVSGIPNSAEEDAMTRYMMGAWASFGRDPSKGLTKYGWPEYKNGGNVLVRLAHQDSSNPQFVDPQLYDSRCPEKNDPLPGQGAF